MAELARTALRHCWEGRPGVVHLDVPETIINGKVKAEVALWQPAQFRRTHAITPPPDQVAQAADMLASATLPIIHAGSGVIHAAAYEELRRVAEALHAPVTTSWAGRGVLPETNELAMPDGADQAQQPGAQRRRRRALPRFAARRNGLVGQGAVLAPPFRAAR